STPWTLLILVVSTVGFGVLASWGTASNFSHLNAHDRATFDATYTTMAGLTLGQLAIAVLGVLVVTTEYSTGGIKSTLTAGRDPQRGPAPPGGGFSDLPPGFALITAFFAAF